MQHYSSHVSRRMSNSCSETVDADCSRLLSSRQLRDVAICPHEKGIVSYARNYSIVEHDLITPNAVRGPSVVYVHCSQLTAPASLQGDWSTFPSPPTPSPRSSSPTPTTPSWRQAARKRNSISHTINVPTPRHHPDQRAAHRVALAAGSGRASTSSITARSTIRSCSRR